MHAIAGSISIEIMIGVFWFWWATWWVPSMWRWHVILPGKRREIEARIDAQYKERDMRRVNQKASVAWAGWRGIIVFGVATLVLVGFTFIVFFAP